MSEWMTDPRFEWPVPPDALRCRREARDRSTGERFPCMLRRGHRSEECFWRSDDGERTMRWVAWSTVTYVGEVGGL